MKCGITMCTMKACRTCHGTHFRLQLSARNCMCHLLYIMTRYSVDHEHNPRISKWLRSMCDMKMSNCWIYITRFILLFGPLVQDEQGCSIRWVVGKAMARIRTECMLRLSRLTSASALWRDDTLVYFLCTFNFNRHGFNRRVQRVDWVHLDSSMETKA